MTIIGLLIRCAVTYQYTLVAIIIFFHGVELTTYLHAVLKYQVLGKVMTTSVHSFGGFVAICTIVTLDVDIETRVTTRWGEIYPIGRVFSFGQVIEKYKISPNYGLRFSTVKCIY
jgi:hypothetical protein